MGKVMKIGCGLLAAPFILMLVLVTAPVTIPLLWWCFKIALSILIIKFMYDCLCLLLGRG
jgi:hypothetical protein